MNANSKTTRPSAYEVAARAKGWSHGGDCGGFIYDTSVWGSWKEAASWAGEEGWPDSPLYDTWKECCAGEDFLVDVDLSAITDADVTTASTAGNVDQAIAPLQEKAGITDGGVAALAFSGFCWCSAASVTRVLQIRRWIEMERSYLPAPAAFTFEQFQATRRPCTDLGAALRDDRWANRKTPASGLLYLGGLYIEDIDHEWTQDMRDRGRYYLLIERDEWISDDLVGLESKLYDFAVSAGCTLKDLAPAAPAATE